MRLPRSSWALLPVLFSLLLDLVAFRYGISLLDEGFLLDPVMRVLGGEVPYRDFYHFYAPGRFYLVALLFSIFGADLLVTRCLWVALHALLAWLIYRTALRLVEKPWQAVLPALFFSAAPGPWFKVFFPLGTVANLLALLRLQERPGRRSLLLAGIVAGTTVVMRQDVGVIALFLGLGTLLHLCRRGEGALGLRAALRAYGGGVALPLLPLLFAFHQAEALVPMAQQLLFAGFRATHTNAVPMPSLLPTPGATPLDLFAGLLHRLPPFLYLVTALRLLLGRERRRRHALLLTTLFGILTYHQDLRRSDIPHLMQCIVPAWLLLPPSLEASGRVVRRVLPSLRPPRSPHLRCALLLALLLPFLLLLTAVDAFDFPHSVLSIRGKGVRLDLAHASVIVRRERAETLEGVVAEIARLPADAPIVALPDIPLIYFLAHRTNPLYFEIFRPGHLDREDERQTIERIERVAPRLIVYDQRHLTDGREENRFERRFPLLFRHILRNYRPFRQIGSFTLLVPKEEQRRDPRSSSTRDR